ncbi:MAG: hypothetical protein Q8O40_06525 [Chloroflexota bacterium]|nr:hypothetical protein [Chloroflexota bacterium]
MMRQVKAAMMAAGSYHIQGQFTATATKEVQEPAMTMTFDGDISVAGDARIVVNLDTLIFSSTMEMRRVGDVTYISMGDGQATEWLQESEDPTISLTDLPEIEVATVEVTTLGGERVSKVSGVASHSGAEAQVALWIGAEDLLVRQWETEGYGGLEGLWLAPMDTQKSYQHMEVRYLAYNESVKVEAPDMTPAPTPTATPTPMPVSSPLGPMQLYKSQKYPFSIQYPDGWLPGVAVPGTMTPTLFFSDDGDMLTIFVEDLVAFGSGEMSLEQYANSLGSRELLGGVYQPSSPVPMTTSQGLTVMVVRDDPPGEEVSFIWMVYVHKNRYAFTAKYFITDRTRLPALEPVIVYSFSSFQVNDTQK